MVRLMIAATALMAFAGTAYAQTTPATPDSTTAAPAPTTTPAPTDTQPGMASPQTPGTDTTAPAPATDTNSTTDESNGKSKKKHKPH